MKLNLFKIKSIFQALLTLFAGVVLNQTNISAQCSPDVVSPFITFCPSNVTLTTNGDTNACQGRKYNWNAEIVDQQNYPGVSTSAMFATDFWQSFTPSVSGALTAIELYTTNGTSAGGYAFSIYSGVGTGGTLLYNAVHFTGVVSGPFKTVLNGVSKLEVVAGQKYTFRIQAPSSTHFVIGNVTPGIETFFTTYGGFPTTQTNIAFKYREYVAPNMVRAIDNCNLVSITSSHPSTQYFPIGTTTVTHTATDAAGNTSQCSFDITVVDNHAPNINSVPTNIVTGNGTGQCGKNVTWTAPVPSDGCGITTFTTTHTSGSFFPIGTDTVIYTATNTLGHSSTASFIVTVNDTQGPTPDLAILPTVTAQCSTTVSTTPTATDNCEGSVPATTTSPLTYSSEGTYTIAWKYTDSKGNTTIQNQTVIIDDNIAPVPNISSLPTVTAQCSTTVSTIPAATDNCAGAITATTTSPLTYNTEGTFTITWKYNDGRGNTSTQNQTVIIDDNMAPVPNAGSLPIISGECSVNVSIMPTATDNCAGSIMATTINPTTYSTEGIHTITWIYNDGRGNSSTQNQTILIDDVTAPVPNVASLPTMTNDCSVILSAPTATDNCAGTITATTTNPTSYNTNGTYNVVWTYNDGRGNSVTQNQTVVINDVTAPIPFPSSLPTINSQCATTLTAPTGIDNCAGTITATTTDPVSYSSEGTYNVVWTYNDGGGNSVTRNQTVIIDDVTAPVPNVASLPNATGQCSVTVSVPTATDNCAGSISATTVDPITYNAEGTYTVHWIYNDGKGNSVTQNQTVIVDDNIAPVVNVPSLPTVTGECSVTVSTVPTATDNCAGTITATTSDPVSYSLEGTYTIVWVYNDGKGNSSSQNQTVIVDDVTAPVPTVASLPDITAECTATVTAPTATDVCSGSVTATTVDPTIYNTQGTFIIHWVYNDGRGNTTTQNQTVIIDDITNPVPTVSSLPAITHECTATLSAPTATDNCSVTITATTVDPLTYNIQGVYVVHWIYNDGNGNSINQDQVVIIDDNTAPVANIPSLAPITGECSATISSAPTATDACVGSITATTTDPLTYSVQGTYTVNWIYNDGRGNSSVQTQTVIVDDITAPVADIASLPDATNECSVTLTAPTATDACTGSITATTADLTTYNTQGTFTVNWVYNDGNGNTSVQTQTVIIDDITDPVPSVGSLPTINDECSATLTAPTATDNCEGTVTATTTDPITYVTEGTYTVNWNYNDGNGNTTIQIQTVIIDDNTNPVADVASLPIITGCSVTATAPTATDNCSGSITATTTDPTSYSTPGIYSITWTYTDVAGNTSIQSQSVEVVDCSGIEYVLTDDGVSVYPNPGNGIFTLSFTSMPTEKVEMRVIDELGRVIYTKAIQQENEIYDLSHLRAGTYYVQVMSNDKMITKKLIVTNQY